MKHNTPFKKKIRRLEKDLQHKAINELIYQYVHDIRSSLTPIKPYAELLKKVEDSTTKNRILDQVSTSSNKIEMLLVQLIKDLDQLCKPQNQ